VFALEVGEKLELAARVVSERMVFVDNHVARPAGRHLLGCSGTGEPLASVEVAGAQGPVLALPRRPTKPHPIHIPVPVTGFEERGVERQRIPPIARRGLEILPDLPGRHVDNLAASLSRVGYGVVPVQALGHFDVCHLVAIRSDPFRAVGTKSLHSTRAAPPEVEPKTGHTPGC